MSTVDISKTSYTVTIAEYIPVQDGDYKAGIKIYEQRVQDLDIEAVVCAVNGFDCQDKLRIEIPQVSLHSRGDFDEEEPM